jgi:cytochrome b involved in lipid metabolism
MTTTLANFNNNHKKFTKKETIRNKSKMISLFVLVLFTLVKLDCSIIYVYALAPSSLVIRSSNRLDSKILTHRRKDSQLKVFLPFRRTVASITKHPPKHATNDDVLEDRFDRTESSKIGIEGECIITIRGERYNMTGWANGHPGGASILKKFHGRDATRVFDTAGHSAEAHAMLHKFRIINNDNDKEDDNEKITKPTNTAVLESNIDVPRWRTKLFTKEDPGIHKYMGVFVLLHFMFRYYQMYFGDPTAGFGIIGNSKGRPGIIAPLCLIPHAILSLSSLIFHTVPKERVVGKPMIWQEYRIHNIIFAMRSLVTAGLTWLSIAKGHSPAFRKLALIGCSASVLVANLAADEGTKRLRIDTRESTTATMPYWDGCSILTQKKFKSFYAYCQFMATLACLSVGNPAWCLAVLFPIQLASLLMTLVRKGIISAKGYHIGYTISLVMPFFVGIRSMSYSLIEFPTMLIIAGILYQLRRRGIGKYTLWIPLVAGRILFGDMIFNYDIW